DFGTVRTMVAARPDLIDRIVDLNARAVSAYLREQIVAGADAVMIFDTWGGMLTAAGYRRHSLRTMRAVLDALAASGASAVGLDWTVDLAAARARIGSRVALQGNLDPLVLLTDPATIEREANAVVDAA